MLDESQAPVPAPPPERVAVFIDYQNIHLSAVELFLPYGAPPWEGHIDPMAYARLLVSKRNRPSLLAQVRVYRGRPVPTHEPGAAAANDRQASAWQRAGVVVCRRPLRYPLDWPDLPAREKGVDVQLACDVIHLAITGQYDVMIIASRDTDLLPALELVRSKKWARVETASWEGASQIRFSDGRGPWCHRLTAEEYAQVRDYRDYRQG